MMSSQAVKCRRSYSASPIISWYRFGIENTDQKILALTARLVLGSDDERHCLKDRSCYINAEQAI